MIDEEKKILLEPQAVEEAKEALENYSAEERKAANKLLAAADPAPKTPPKKRGVGRPQTRPYSGKKRNWQPGRKVGRPVGWKKPVALADPAPPATGSAPAAAGPAAKPPAAAPTTAKKRKAAPAPGASSSSLGPAPRTKMKGKQPKPPGRTASAQPRKA